MKIFLDTAEVEEIREAADWGVLSGVTTNPTLVAKSGRDFSEVVRKIAQIAQAPVSAEVVSTDARSMIEEGREYAKWSPHVVVKAPMTPEGLKATSTLAAEGINVNVTLIFSANQALLAARAGAAYVSPFIGRLDDISQSGIEVVSEIAEIFLLHDIRSEIIAASIRHPVHVAEAAKAGAHIATMPFKVLKRMTEHPLTDQGLERFLKDWADANKS